MHYSYQNCYLSALLILRAFFFPFLLWLFLHALPINHFQKREQFCKRLFYKKQIVFWALVYSSGNTQGKKVTLDLCQCVRQENLLPSCLKVMKKEIRRDYVFHECSGPFRVAWFSWITNCNKIDSFQRVCPIIFWCLCSHNQVLRVMFLCLLQFKNNNLPLPP